MSPQTKPGAVSCLGGWVLGSTCKKRGTGLEAHLLKHVLAELQILHQALASVLQVHTEQGLLAQLLPGCDQTCVQLRGSTQEGRGEEEEQGEEKGGEESFRLH